MYESASAWLKRAITAEDCYDRFISAYVALNFLYNERDESSERVRMVNYLVEAASRSGVDPFACNVDEYLAAPVINMRSHMRGTNSCKVERNNNRELFNAIYQVRCNFFHGNKCLGNPRDQRLVQQGADVIIRILTKELCLNETP